LVFFCYLQGLPGKSVQETEAVESIAAMGVPEGVGMDRRSDEKGGRRVEGGGGREEGREGGEREERREERERKGACIHNSLDTGLSFPKKGKASNNQNKYPAARA
jgi:hypothetical protein